MRTDDAAMKLGRRRGRYSQAVRLLHLLDELHARSRAVPLRELADRFDVSERQLRRDVEALEHAGYPVEIGPHDGRTHVRLLEPRGGNLRLSLRQRFVLLAARRTFDMLRGTPFQEDLRAICGKILALLPKEEQLAIDRLDECFRRVPSHDGSYEDKHDVIDGLLTGILRRWQVRADYAGAGTGAFSGILEPYVMVLRGDDLYVIGRCNPPREPIAPFRVKAFVQAEYLRGHTFEVPAGFRAEDYF